MQYYKDNWETYWKEIEQNQDVAPWDIASPASIEEDLKLMIPYFNRQKLLVDLGCGTGIETLALGKHFEKVIGLDVSPSVIQQARQQQLSPNIDFQQLDALNTLQVDRFLAQNGSANIYLRGVLQQIQLEDQPLFLKNLKKLLGNNGFLYFKEISTEAKPFFQKIIFEKRKLPQHLHRVLIQQVTKLVGLNIDQVSALFTTHQFRVEEVGKTYIELFFDEETTLQVPATYGIIGTL